MYICQMYNALVVPAIALRKEPRHPSELVSQLIYGDRFRIVDQDGRWMYVEGVHDHYAGWAEMPVEFYQPVTDLKASLLVISFSARLKGPIGDLRIPMGSMVEPHSLITGEGSTANSKMAALDALECIFRELIGAPYLWGGRTGFGMDCSGLSQLYYRMLGVDISRDASQQARQGDDLFLSQVRPGDLLFFKNNLGKIIHVGMVYSDQRILHASGLVRTDRFDEKGIYHERQKAYTH
ncbi:MAG TPA: C40 family peptidase, partial [Saprospiraceae bacterium]|nr:C40 family peptidase [Saprospiraceae bacterium]